VVDGLGFVAVVEVAAADAVQARAGARIRVGDRLHRMRTGKVRSAYPS
jgi:hypothetical protein